MPVLLFDFDSTLVQDEGLDELFRFSLEGRRDAGERLSAFRAITDRGMEGLLSWEESLRARMELVVATRELVERTGRHLARRLTPSVERHAAAGFFRSAGCDIHIVSGGFTELITPAAERLGIPPERVHAHRFRFDHRGRVAGADPDTALARGGKVEAVRRLGLDPARTWIIGDGATDLELRERGAAAVFVAFTENRRREPVVASADHEVPSLDALITLLEGV
jgi:D-3-phosphoglycerate dehydrogenase / 2-oxoglutarate reductase